MSSRTVTTCDVCMRAIPEPDTIIQVIDQIEYHVDVTAWQNNYQIDDVCRTCQYNALKIILASMQPVDTIEAAPVAWYPPELLEEIRQQRQLGRILGELIPQYGVNAVVAAIGVLPIAQQLGIPDTDT